jgi:hypothetical protein
MMRRTTLLVTLGVSVLALLALVVGAALATTPKGVTPTPLTRATLGKFEAENNGIEVDGTIIPVSLWFLSTLVQSLNMTRTVTRASSRQARVSLRLTAKCMLCATEARLMRFCT